MACPAHGLSVWMLRASRPTRHVACPVDSGEHGCFACRCNGLAVAGSICHIVNALISGTKPALTKTPPDDVKNLASTSLDIFSDPLFVEVTLGHAHDKGGKYHNRDGRDVTHTGAILNDSQLVP
jgi:hypothetical protein